MNRLTFLPLLMIVVPAFAGDEVMIQNALDSVKAFRLEPGRTYALDAPLTLRAGMSLIGAGFPSVLAYRAPGEFAILFGESGDKHNYGCCLKDLVVKAGGVRVQRFGQHCLIDGVWSIGAPAAGFHIEGPGDRFLLRDCVAWNCGEGFVIRTSNANNGLILEHCNAQGCQGYGLRCETIDHFHAYLGELLVRDFTGQGNARDGQTPAKILLAGTITECRFQHLYIEAVTAEVGLRCEARRFPDKDPPRAPRNIYVDDNSRVDGKAGKASVELIDCEGFVVRDSRLRLPIRRGQQVLEPVQSGVFRASIEVIQPASLAKVGPIRPK